mmetsp:Transcript_3545/g.8903  ORF Transcript_3545/g.8903 Transcript_3545/m.8903 type:complete len:209 (-) Transcript_3545:428-1054(-)
MFTMAAVRAARLTPEITVTVFTMEARGRLGAVTAYRPRTPARRRESDAPRATQTLQMYVLVDRPRLQVQEEIPESSREISNSRQVRCQVRYHQTLPGLPEGPAASRILRHLQCPVRAPPPPRMGRGRGRGKGRDMGRFTCRGRGSFSSRGRGKAVGSASCATALFPSRLQAPTINRTVTDLGKVSSSSRPPPSSVLPTRSIPLRSRSL